ncbi:MAG TPA: hypothetical protein PLD19_08610 [Luteimonas sp.]|nr:hypothetical protein [Luteimonas sp.]
MPMPHTPLRLIMLGACALALAACQREPDPLQLAREEIAANLPAPYFEDLVTESASIEGKRLVLLVRSPEGDADRTRAQPQFELLRQSEQDEMRQLCAHPAIARLVDGDTLLVRRFVDRFDKVFFETTLPARDCASPDTRAPT